MADNLEEQIEYFAQVRNYAETKQRKDMVDNWARSYIMKYSKTIEEYDDLFLYYSDVKAEMREFN